VGITKEHTISAPNHDGKADMVSGASKAADGEMEEGTPPPAAAALPREGRVLSLTPSIRWRMEGRRTTRRKEGPNMCSDAGIRGMELEVKYDVEKSEMKRGFNITRLFRGRLCIKAAFPHINSHFVFNNCGFRRIS
jgi:hypothetical protein